MTPELTGIWERMRDLGLGALAHANRHTHYGDYHNQWWAELGVLQAAHSAELLLKARIAEEHPLLIFEDLPKADLSRELTLKDLFEKGRTIQWADHKRNRPVGHPCGAANRLVC